ncbi:MAG TPA: hypothetical protein VM369_10760 [Candidatus Binatia bacterium]|nr:hypothetical protein [Candidatus Binatia bacterium]
MRVGARLLAVQDDAFAAVWIEPAGRLEPWLLRGDGVRLGKPLKPDFEAALAHDGVAWLLGSGSLPQRCAVARLDLARGRAEVQARPGWYAAIAEVLGAAPNIEGAARHGGALWLTHRGAGTSASALLRMAPGALEHAVPAIESCTRCDLGSLDGVPLHFTDAAAGPSALWFLAAAECTPDAIADGPVTGSVLGRIESDGARWVPVLEADGQRSRAKFEGLVVEEGGASAWLLSDPDDAAAAARLCRVRLRGFG